MKSQNGIFWMVHLWVLAGSLKPTIIKVVHKQDEFTIKCRILISPYFETIALGAIIL
jgi:hypothetical protein